VERHEIITGKLKTDVIDKRSLWQAFGNVRLEIFLYANEGRFALF